MFEDILQFSDPVIESNIELADYLGIEQDIAIEGASEFIESAKKKLSSAIERLSAFIQRITNKVKELFYKLVKKSTYKVDQAMYRQLNGINKELNKAIPGVKSAFKAGFIAARNNNDAKIPEGMLAKLNEETAQSHKILDEFEKSQSAEFLNDVLNGTKVPENKTTLVLRPEHITDIIRKLEESLTTLEASKKTMSDAVASINESTQVNSKALSALVEQTNVVIRIINNRMKIYNALNKIAIKEADK